MIANIWGPWIGINILSFECLFLASSICIALETHWSVGLAFFFCLASATLSANGLLYTAGEYQDLYMHHLSAMALCSALIIPPIIRHIDFKKAMACIGIINVLDSVLVLVQFARSHSGDHSGGLLLNPSMNASFLAVTLLSVPSVFVIFPLAAIMASWASVPIAVVGAVVCAYIIALKQSWKIMASAIFFIALAAYFTPNILNDSGRFAQWGASIDYWHDYIGGLGSGAGTYALHGSVISGIRQLKSWELWGFMHNDWLQIFFQGGYMAIEFVALMFSFMLFKSWKRPQLFATIAGYGVFGMFNMPLEYLPTAFIGALLVKESFTNDRKEGG